MCIKRPHVADWVLSVSQQLDTSQRGKTSSYFSFLLSYVSCSSVSLLFFFFFPFHCLSQTSDELKTKAAVAVWSLRRDVIMTSPLKVELSHRHDEVHGERGEVKGLEEQEVLKYYIGPYRAYWGTARISSGFVTTRSVTTINAKLVSLQILKTEANTKNLRPVLKLKGFHCIGTRSLEERLNRRAENLPLRLFSNFSLKPPWS